MIKGSQLLSIKQAAAVLGLSVDLVRSAKTAGCLAFRNNRVHAGELEKWLEENKEKLKGLKEKVSLKEKKLRREIEILELRIARERGELWDSGEVREAWIRVLGALRISLMIAATQSAAASPGRTVADIEAINKAGVENALARIKANPFGDAKKVEAV